MNRKVLRNNKFYRFLVAVTGVFIYALGMNLFIIPENTYSGGLMGICQLLGYVMTNYLHISLSGINFTGILYYLLNIPIFIWAYRNIGKGFVAKTLACATLLSVFMIFIPIPSTPMLLEDTLGSCIIGGILTGVGVGMTLSYGSSMGGLDIIGLILTKQKKASSIGNLYIVINAILYGCCFFIFDVKTVIYSIIVTFISSFTIDRVHLQNINCEVKVITKHLDKDMQEEIMKDMYRGITRVNCKGAYTEDDEYIFFIMISKYELERLEDIVHKYDPDAWIIVNEKVSIHGAFIKKL